MSLEEAKTHFPEFVLKKIFPSVLFRVSPKFTYQNEGSQNYVFSMVEKYSPSIPTVKEIKQSPLKKVPVYITVLIT